MSIKKEIYRIIDANFNRSREGLRVCEDISRFIMNDSALTKELKGIRHRISGILQSSPKIKKTLIRSRNAADDVGRAPSPRIELSRRGLDDIFTANIERVKESIRVLEEFFKFIDSKDAVKLSRLRFKTYSIEKKALAKLDSFNHTRRPGRDTPR